jgi:hypothetical protein
MKVVSKQLWVMLDIYFYSPFSARPGRSQPEVSAISELCVVGDEFELHKSNRPSFVFSCFTSPVPLDRSVWVLRSIYVQ